MTTTHPLTGAATVVARERAPANQLPTSAISRKGYWRMSQNEIVRFALNNRWLEEQGVPDMNAPPR